MTGPTLVLLSNLETIHGEEVIRHLVDTCQLKGCNAAFIASEPDNTRYFYTKTQAFYKTSGINLDCYIDFESGYNESLFQEVLGKPIVHLSGGNTYRFLQGMQQRNAATRLRQYVQNGGVLIGVSAGAMLLTPSIDTAEICGDTNQVNISNTKAMGLTEFLYSPHYRGNPKEEAMAKELATKHSRSIYLCRDSDSLIISNGRITTFGSPQIVTS